MGGLRADDSAALRERGADVLESISSETPEAAAQVIETSRRAKGRPAGTSEPLTEPFESKTMPDNDAIRLWARTWKEFGPELEKIRLRAGTSVRPGNEHTAAGRIGGTDRDAAAPREVA
jgi:hypothetical protein